MKKDSKAKAERAVALVKAAIDAMRRAQTAPDSPVNHYTSVPERSELRRKAKRLRKGQLQPTHRNIHTGEQLADIYNRTILRDDIFDRERLEFMRANRELAPIIEEGDPEVQKAIDALVDEMQRAAREDGPGSEADYRLQCLQFLGAAGQKWHDQKRRDPNTSPTMHIAPQLTSDPLAQRRMEVAAAEILTSVPDGEQVWKFPAVESGARRLLLRIGVGPVSWIASFERGNKGPSTVQLMPGDTHFFVSAAGAGYIIEAETRTLVEKIGDDVVSVGCDNSRTRFFVNHDDRCLQAFGPAGWQWTSENIGLGFRGLMLNGNYLLGEAQRTAEAEWSTFSVDVATGEVRWEGKSGLR